MIKLPFSSLSFASEMKPLISGVNLSLEYENVESSLSKIAVDIRSIISAPMYDKIVEWYDNAPEDSVLLESVQLLQRSMLHFLIYEHSIFLITRVSNDGITIKKNDDETTAFKYQTDELNRKLITTAWFWMNQLIRLMDSDSEKFNDWHDSDMKKTRDKLPVSLSDFTLYVGLSTSGGEYFIISSAWIIREAYTDCLLSRGVSEFPTAKPETHQAKKALCYEVMGRACQLMPYASLPEPIRIDIDNEFSRSNRDRTEDDVRSRIASRFLKRAEAYWKVLDSMLIRANAVSSTDAYQLPNISESDSFIYS